MEGMFFDFNDSTYYGSQYEGNDSLIDNEDTDSVVEDIDSVIDDEEMHSDDEDGIQTEHNDLSQTEEIAKKYYDLIKKKDRGGLFYPSDSVYRIAIFADIVFTTALKDSGRKMLKKNTH